MSRCAPAKVRNLVDASKIVFVISILLAFALRRGLAETKLQFPWLGAALFALIVLSGGFVVVATLIYRKPEASAEDE